MMLDQILRLIFIVLVRDPTRGLLCVRVLIAVWCRSDGAVWTQRDFNQLRA